LKLESPPFQGKPFLTQAYHLLALCRYDLPILKICNQLFETKHLYHHESLLLLWK